MRVMPLAKVHMLSTKPYTRLVNNDGVFWTLGTLGGVGEGTCIAACAKHGSICSEPDLAALTNKEAAKVAFAAAGVMCVSWDEWDYGQGVSQCTEQSCCGGSCVGYCVVPKSQVLYGHCTALAQTLLYCAQCIPKIALEACHAYASCTHAGMRNEQSASRS